MTVQPAAPDDLDAVRDLLRTVALPHEDLTPAHLTDFLVARDGEALGGIVGLELSGDAALLRSLAVVPERRNEGVGADLVDAVEERARQQEIHTLYLLTTTAADYFQARGYTQTERDALPESIQQTEEAARLCPDRAVCMRKKLTTTDGRS